jgi:hypothetical protein
MMQYELRRASDHTSPSSRGLGRGPFKAETRVRIPVGTNPFFGCPWRKSAGDRSEFSPCRGFAKSVSVQALIAKVGYKIRKISTTAGDRLNAAILQTTQRLHDHIVRYRTPHVGDEQTCGRSVSGLKPEGGSTGGPSVQVCLYWSEVIAAGR